MQLADDAARDVRRDLAQIGLDDHGIEGLDDERAADNPRGSRRRACVSRMSPSNLLLISMTSGTRPAIWLEEALKRRDLVRPWSSR